MRLNRWGLLLVLPVSVWAAQPPLHPGWPQPMHNDMPMGSAMLNQNELRSGDGASTYRWEGEAWYGWNLNRVWLRSEGSVDTHTGRADEAEVQALYSHAWTRYFDVQAGVRHDFEPRPSRNWLTLGVKGLAPMFWDVGAFVFVRDGGQVSARLEASYDLYLTQRLILQPQFEINGYTRADGARGIGAGVADLDSGLRLRYEIRRQFAPYLGVTYASRFGQTADFSRLAGEAVSDMQWVAGIRVWY